MPSSSSIAFPVPVPVFHPDHPHNRQHYPLYESSANIPSLAGLRNPSSAFGNGYGRGHEVRGKMNPSSSSGSGIARYAQEDIQSDSESSMSPSPKAKGRCFCGNPTQDGGIYCSVACARSDAFSSLCYKPTEPTLPHHATSLSLGEASASLSRNPSSASASSVASGSSYHDADWNASHYRRLARADIRRDERREERRRRRAEGSLASSISTSRSTIMSTSSSATRAVPELVGGAGASHSRNPSIASSITSISSSSWGAGSLSRNASSASTASRRGYGNNVNVGAVIHEDDDEEEWLQAEPGQTYVNAQPISSSKRPQHKRGDSRSTSSRKGRKPTPDPLPFGMGKDMRDVLEEIIQMEKSFLVSDNDDNDEDDGMAQSAPSAGLFTTQFDRPPRTPSPVSAGKRRASIAPGAPIRGHRSTLSHSALVLEPSYQVPAPPAPRQRPPSLIGLHQSSLSESHTALYLATASPVGKGRRSASPQLEARKSMTFTPDAAGPSISVDGLSAPSRRIFDSPAGSNITPVSRRRLNHTPQAVHPSMNGWRFPSPMNAGSTMATPTRPSTSRVPTLDELSTAEDEAIEPALLWPRPPNLQPALFPSSPAIDTPGYPELERPCLKRSESGSVLEERDVSAPGSGLRLGVLLGSGTDDAALGPAAHDEMDVDIDMDEDEDGSTEQGHGHGHNLAPGHRMGYLPVFLEAEGFRAGDAARRW